MDEGKRLPRLGQVVRSAAGRDRDSCYLVLQVIGSRFVAVADGRARTTSNPKRKNVRHLDFVPRIVESLAQRLERGERVEDDEIRQALQELAPECVGPEDRERERGKSNVDGQG